MLLVLILNVRNFSGRDLSSASRTPLLLGHLVDDIASKLIFLDFSGHKPVAMQTFEVIPVEAFIYSTKIRSIREFHVLIIVLLILFNIVFKAYSAPSSERVIVLCEYLPNLLMCVVHQSIVIFVFLSLLGQNTQPKFVSSEIIHSLLFNRFEYIINLIIIQALHLLKLKLRWHKWIL